MGMPEDTIELLLHDPNNFLQYSNEKVRKKILNHNNNTIELNFKKNKEEYKCNIFQIILKSYTLLPDTKEQQTIQE